MVLLTLPQKPQVSIVHDQKKKLCQKLKNSWRNNQLKFCVTQIMELAGAPQ